MSSILIKNGLIIPVDGRNHFIKDGAVAISDNQIVAVGPTDEVKRDYGKAEYVIDASKKAVLPGIVNAHTHVGTMFFKAITEDREMAFYRVALPMEDHVRAEDVYNTSLLGCLETVKAGSTCINDIWHYMTETAKAAEKLGIRAVLANKVKEADLGKIQFGKWELDSNEGLKRLNDNIFLVKNWHGKARGRITCRIGTHATDTLSPELLIKAKEVAKELGVGLHIHVAQSRQEVSHIQGVHGMGCVEFLNSINFLGPDVIAAHCTFISEKEIAILRRTKTNMAHCPMILAKRGAFPPMDKIYQYGINVAYGTDWLSMDPFENMRFAIGITRVKTGSIAMVDAVKALTIATIGGAHALGLEGEIGSLEVGKKADIIMIDLNKPHLVPIREFYKDIIANIVYNANGNDVHTVIIDGRIIVEGHKCITVDEQEVMDVAQETAEDLWVRSEFVG